MRDLVEHGIAEERIEGHVGTLVLGDQLLAEGDHDLIELGLHRILELQASRASCELHLLVVGQIDRDGLRARVRVTRVVDDVVRVQVGVGAGRLGLVAGVDGQSALETR